MSSHSYEYHYSVMQGIHLLLKNDSFVDCTLAAEGQLVNAHKVVLSACSPYFQLLFSQQKEKYPIVFLKDVRYENVKSLVDLMYKGRIKIPEKEKDEFLSIAKSLQINGLMGDDLSQGFECDPPDLPLKPNCFPDEESTNDFVNEAQTNTLTDNCLGGLVNESTSLTNGMSPLLSESVSFEFNTKKLEVSSSGQDCRGSSSNSSEVLRCDITESNVEAGSEKRILPSSVTKTVNSTPLTSEAEGHKIDNITQELPLESSSKNKQSRSLVQNDLKVLFENQSVTTLTSNETALQFMCFNNVDNSEKTKLVALSNGKASTLSPCKNKLNEDSVGHKFGIETIHRRQLSSYESGRSQYSLETIMMSPPGWNVVDPVLVNPETRSQAGNHSVLRGLKTSTDEHFNPQCKSSEPGNHLGKSDFVLSNETGGVLQNSSFGAWWKSGKGPTVQTSQAVALVSSHPCQEADNDICEAKESVLRSLFGSVLPSSPVSSWLDLADLSSDESSASLTSEESGSTSPPNSFQREQLKGNPDFKKPEKQGFDIRSQKYRSGSLQSGKEINNQLIGKPAVQNSVHTVEKSYTSHRSSSVESEKRKKHICPECSAPCSSASKLRKHMKVHKKKFKFVCSVCCCAFTQESELSVHICNDPSKATFQCSKCSLRFYKKEELASHTSTHEQFTCKECGFEFTNKSLVESHMQTHHMKGPFKCPACSKIFEARNGLIEHLHCYEHAGQDESCVNYGKHNILIKEEKQAKIWGGDGLFRCHSCNEGFTHRMLMREHVHDHLSENKCLKCDASFEQKNDLFRHILVNSSRKPFRCQICYAKFSLKHDHAIHHEIYGVNEVKKGKKSKK